MPSHAKNRVSHASRNYLKIHAHIELVVYRGKGKMKFVCLQEAFKGYFLALPDGETSQLRKCRF